MICELFIALSAAIMPVRHISAQITDAQQIPAVISENKVEYHRLDCINWPESYPYCPNTEFAICHNGDGILLHFKVCEKGTAAVYGTADGDPVWKDSACEFFFAPDLEGDGIYYNLECNCIGNILYAGSAQRYERTAAGSEVLGKILRWSSLGKECFPAREGETQWELALYIPKEAVFLHKIPSFDSLTIRGNFHKVGNKLVPKQFVTYFPIGTPKADLHKTEYFGVIRFE